MRRLVLCGISPEAEGRAAKRALAVCVLSAVLLSGCASQTLRTIDFYEPTETTLHEREDGLKVGAVKSETVKSGQPDWSGNKTFSLFSW